MILSLLTKISGMQKEIKGLRLLNDNDDLKEQNKKKQLAVSNQRRKKNILVKNVILLSNQKLAMKNILREYSHAE